MVSRTVSVEEAGRLIGVSRGSAYEAVRSGSLPSLRVGRRVVVPLGRLAELLGETPESLVSALETPDAHGVGEAELISSASE
jgi:excisionase family DNA binding protein